MGTIIKRELLDHLQSLQFVVLLAITVILFCTDGFLFVKRYDQQTRWYSAVTREIAANPSTVGIMLPAPPCALLFMAEGGERYLPASYSLRPKGFLQANPTSEQRNHKMPEIPPIDWAFIIKMLFSLYAFLLGYNAIAGEKEQGTLREILSYPLGRIRLLAGKYVAIMLTLLVPLLTGVLLTLIMVSIGAPDVLTGAALGRIGLMLLLAGVYLSTFVCISLLLSALVHDSSVVLLSLLAIWIVSAVILPNTAGIVAGKLAAVPSEYQAAKQLDPLIEKQVWAKIEAIRSRVGQGEISSEEELRRACDRAFEEGQTDMVKYYENYHTTMRARADMARRVARLSPTSLFQFAAEQIAGSGPGREDRLLKDMKQYAADYDRYILAKTGKVVGVSQWSFSTFMDLNGKEVLVRSPFPQEYQGDKSDIPRFQPSSHTIADGLRDAMIDIAGLLLWNLLFAIAAFSAMLQSDVR